MEYSESKVIGKGHATVINLDYFVTANEATYDTQSGEIILNGNVNAYKGNSLYLKAQNVKIKIQQDYSFLEPFYLQDSMSGLWVDAKMRNMTKIFIKQRKRLFQLVVSIIQFGNLKPAKVNMM